MGEAPRLRGGVRRVVAVEQWPVQPGFNLDVAGTTTPFAGDAAALVHDNSLTYTRLVPYDAPTALVASGAASR